MYALLATVAMQTSFNCTPDEAPRETQMDMDIASLLPSDSRGVLAIDVEGLLASNSAAQITALLKGAHDVDPALGELLGAIGRLAEQVDLADSMRTALFVQTTDPQDGHLLLAKMRHHTLDDVSKGPALVHAGTYGAGGYATYLDANGSTLTMLPGGVLIVGKQPAVLSVLDVADGLAPANDSSIAPFSAALDFSSPFTFVYGLPAMFDSSITPDKSLRGAKVLSGSLDFTGSNVSGRVSFHTSNASEFVDVYNRLNDAAGEEPLVLDAPVAEGLSQVVVTIGPTPISKTGDDLINSRNTLKKLFPIMQAYDYAEGVHDPGNKPWLDLIVKSEQNGDGSPGSVFIRWEFKDSAAIEAFEKNELPAGFKLTPCQFLESDKPDYFLALNLYNSTGGSIVHGARAEWDVFVRPPDGDPRPRFMVIDALAESISADAVHGLTPGEPLSHAFVDDRVVSSIAKMENGVEKPVFWSSFPKPIRTSTNVARFTREMAIGNDYIYWGHGVRDRVLYNASTFNYDALFADINQVQVVDNSHWSQYLREKPTYAIYYTNTLEYVAAPWDNLDSPHLDVTPEWLDQLYGFKNNGSYLNMMRDAVVCSFRGKKDAMTPFTVENTTPSTYYSFRITDDAAMSAALNLPAGTSLAKTRFFENSPTEEYYLTLSIYEIMDSVEGVRAEWSTYVDDGKGREHLMILDSLTEDAALDPVSLINLPSNVRHELAGGTLSTSLSSASIEFAASLNTYDSALEPLALDWIEAGELVCHRNGICDKLFYDAETLDVPVHRLASATVDTMRTPWNEFIDVTPSAVFYRDNLQEYVIKPWHNLKVMVADPTPSPVGDGTHVISGTGTLVGRTSHAVDSTYVYSGAAMLEGNELHFNIDQQIDNALGRGNIFSSGSFDLTTGLGTATLESCFGPPLMCAAVDPVVGTPDATSEYVAQNLDASDRGEISWDVIMTLVIAGFGEADSVSSISATAVDHK
jgi:hypothetical protein